MTYQLLLINKDTDGVLRIECDLPELILIGTNAAESFGAVLESCDEGDPEFAPAGLALGVGQSIVRFVTNEQRYVNVPKCRICNRALETEEFAGDGNHSFCSDHQPDLIIRRFLEENLDAYLDSGDHYSRQLIDEDIRATFSVLPDNLDDIIQQVLDAHPEPSPRVVVLADGTPARIAARVPVGTFTLPDGSKVEVTNPTSTD